MANNNCSNCYNGCPQIVSDQCVKYTGIDVPILGIQKGDSLSYVEQALVTFLTSTLDGTGIKPIINPDIICPLVNGYLVQCEDLNVNNLFETLIKVVCDLQVQIDGIDSAITVIQNTLNTLNADYDVDCLSGVTNSSDTHAVLQAVIDKLCQFIIDVDLTYVKIADIDTYIQNYLNSIAGADLYSSKMVPYIAYEYYGPLVDPLDPTTGFGPTGAGFGKWINVFLCNGDNGTPDKRGRVAVGVTSGMNGSIPMDSAVNPALGNPSYTIGNTSNGTNKIILNALQIPTHQHANVLNFSDPEHFHYQYAPTASNGSGAVDVSTTTYPNFRHDLENGLSYRTTGTSTLASIGKTSSNSTGITCTLTNVDAGGDEPHDNFQPGIGAYYIMYIP